MSQGLLWYNVVYLPAISKEITANPLYVRSENFIFGSDRPPTLHPVPGAVDFMMYSTDARCFYQDYLSCLSRNKILTNGPLVKVIHGRAKIARGNFTFPWSYIFRLFMSFCLPIRTHFHYTTVSMSFAVSIRILASPAR